MGYDVWTALEPETVVDTSDTMELKLRAMSMYKTQLIYRNYDPIVRGLDAYRALLLESGATFGEAFTGHYKSGSAP
jgi:LmbE family N-acetylglucosaminyl deacetylase